MPEPTTNHSPLLSDFAPHRPSQWEEAARSLLKGQPLSKITPRRIREGIPLEPIYSKETLDSLPEVDSRPGMDGSLRGSRLAGYRLQPWQIAQELPYGPPAEFNRALRADLMKGQDALNVVFDIASLRGADPDAAATGEVGACGLSIASLADLRVAFKGLAPEAVAIHLRGGANALPLVALFVAWLHEQDADLSQIQGSLGMDPLAVQAAAGTTPAALSRHFEEQTLLARFCHSHLPGMQSIGVSTLPYHQAGGTAVDELGLAIATATAYLRNLLEAGFTPAEAAAQIRFSLCIGPTFFTEVAKFRALRPLWIQVLRAFGHEGDDPRVVLHARTGLYQKTRLDPHVNLLRVTTEALSAVLGGVDSLCVGTFDETLREPNDFSRRLARNLQVILQEECGLTRTIDPAGGAWGIEWMSRQLAERAWSLFQEIEAEGGMTAALESGWVSERLRGADEASRKALSQRRARLIGTNFYALTDPKPLESTGADYREIRNQRAREVAAQRIAVGAEEDAAILEALGQLVDAPAEKRVAATIEAAARGATLGEMCHALRPDASPSTTGKPLSAQRLAQPYEELRQRVDDYRKQEGEAPRILLLNWGPVRRHQARNDFSRGFFEAGGFEVLSSESVASAAEAVEAVAQSASGIVVLCGHDEDYLEHFNDLARALKEAQPDLFLVLAGHPGEAEAKYREAGMDDFIHLKSNHLQTNRDYLQGLGVL